MNDTSVQVPLGNFEWLSTYIGYGHQVMSCDMNCHLIVTREPLVNTCPQNKYIEIHFVVWNILLIY